MRLWRFDVIVRAAGPGPFTVRPPTLVTKISPAVRVMI